MTKLKTMNKLGNAIRACRGIRWSSSSLDQPRRDQAAIDRIERWHFRAKLKGCL